MNDLNFVYHAVREPFSGVEAVGTSQSFLTEHFFTWQAYREVFARETRRYFGDFLQR